MSTKQEVYQHMLRLALPHTRGALSSRFVFGKVRREAYELSELVHNIPVSILNENFMDHDNIWYLNNQAKIFYENSKSNFLHEQMRLLISELFLLVPEELERELLWSGPAKI